MSTCKITRHAEQRLRERVGIPKKAVIRAAEKALEHGIGVDDVSGGLRRYYEYLFAWGNGEADNIRLYGDFIYVFHRHILITVLNVPPEHRRQAKFIQQRRKRDEVHAQRAERANKVSDDPEGSAGRE